ncbi:Uncharacterised protein [uncultured archaeon]|nr:Uncharacterised protein [uncultured archaeon]
MVQNIRALLIIEVAGRPPEHLSEAIRAHVEKLNFVKGVKLVNATYATPKKIEEEKDLYTTFSEVEVQTDSIQKLIDIVFEFMPSSVEVLEPSEVVFDIQETTNILNDITGRLHKYDDVAKIAQFQIQNLTQRIQQLQRPMFQANQLAQPLKVSVGEEKKPEAKKATEKKQKKTKKK